MTITVHHLNNSRSQRILWLLEELGADYEIEHYQRDAESNLAPPELKNAHPLGKSPLIEDDGLRVAESGAIIQYLCERHGGENWLPDPKSEDHVRHLEWMQFGESSFFVPVMLKIYAGRLGDAATPLMPRVDEQFEAHVKFAEDNISDDLHFVGNDWSAADVMMSFPAEIAVMQGYGEKAPKLAKFVEAIHARPAWQRARERGGPYFIW
ncbi:glutathione S-transferase [Erythrobacter sp.]|uniref:glutathione S-transferase family protein n=1 Tax=Erythrobacter sp. TaxID=1042 RepID=UPI001AFD1D5A|nr:glutathione S-transferase [Erythrobacter sp.]MBO6526367.1 glutathione S-transferase [Erythrobacter sp.]MBO6530620.1 glutathione S-transferase [Erythrobacter sp.]